MILVCLLTIVAGFGLICYLAGRDDGRGTQHAHLTAQLRDMEKRLSAQMDSLTTNVRNMTTVVDSVLALLTGLSKRLSDALASGDPVALQALADEVAADSQKLADAVVANTPAS